MTPEKKHPLLDAVARSSANIRFVLVEPENPDNIGAVARAMKNMGFMDLRLIKPPHNWRSKSQKMAMHANDVLHEAKVTETVAEALEDVHLTIATSRRTGPRRGRFTDFNSAIKQAKKVVTRQRIAFVFGKESVGLDNEALDLCDLVAIIPTNPACPSINLAQAVMITAFSMAEIAFSPMYNDRKNNVMKVLKKPAFVDKKEITDVLNVMEETLIVLGYKRGHGSRAVERIKASWHGLFKRSGLLGREIQMLKGFTRRVRERAASDGTSAKKDLH